MSRPATLAGIVRVLGGDLYDGGRRACVPGPDHSAADRSVSLLLSNGRVVAHSFAGDDWRAVLDRLRALGLLDADGRPCGAGAPAPDPLGRAARVACALRLWEAGAPVSGTLAERCLRLRGVARPLGEALRSHPAVRAAVYAGRGPLRPALLAAIRDPSGALCGVEVAYLAPDGRTARMPLPRKVVGLAGGGAAVRLDPAGPELLVGEGVATCLSASERLGLPAWALLSAGNLARWSPPEGVRRVTVAADRGRAGEAAAAALAARLRRAGVAVTVRLPPPPFGDWNECAARGA